MNNTVIYFCIYIFFNTDKDNVFQYLLNIFCSIKTSRPKFLLFAPFLPCCCKTYRPLIKDLRLSHIVCSMPATPIVSLSLTENSIVSAINVQPCSLLDQPAEVIIAAVVTNIPTPYNCRPFSPPTNICLDSWLWWSTPLKHWYLCCIQFVSQVNAQLNHSKYIGHRLERHTTGNVHFIIIYWSSILPSCFKLYV